MHRANNAVIMQTEQLGWIEVLEEELCSFRMKVEEQDQVIAQLVGDNLKHLQDNMCHRTLFLLVFFVHFRPNFTSHSLPHLFFIMFIFDMFPLLCLHAHDKRQEHDSTGITGHRTTRLLSYRHPETVLLWFLLDSILCWNLLDSILCWNLLRHH